MNLPPVSLARLLEHTADAVQAVRSGQSLNAWLPRLPAELRPGVQALSFQVLRRLGAALEVRSQLAPKVPPPNVDALLVSALALLWPDERPPYPDHTLVDQAVSAARQRVPAAAAFINAVLRRFVRERQAQVQAASRSLQAAFNHPPWWVERLRQDWPGQWMELLRQANLHPPMTLRVNARRSSGQAYVQRLAALGIAARLLEDPALAGQAVVLAQPRPVQQLPGFAEGEVSVQDAAAQRAAPLLLHPSLPRLANGARVLDACAAPGGKTAHLLELAEPELLALDIDAQRLGRVQDNLTRLRLQATLKAGDARSPAAWWDGRPFQAILLDAPCTASGIVRRHPDVRWLRRADDIATLARVQAQMLDALWPLLAPGGRLLYASCSLFKAEGERQIDAFLQRLGPAVARLAAPSPGHLLPLVDNSRPAATGHGADRAALPPQEPAPGSKPGHEGTADQDGFFYALIEKT